MRARALAMPFVAATAVLVVGPALATLGLAFTDYDALSAPRWNGLANFRRLAADPLFRTALFNSVVFVAIAVPLRVAGSLGAALLYARRARGVGSARALTYLPTVVPDVSYALLWLWLFNPIYGPLGFALGAAGIDTPVLLSAWGARLAVVALSLFQIGEGFLVALAARHEVPPELYELARLDGAGPVRTFRRITLPMLAPALVLLAARDVAFSFQASFVPALVLTDGGPLYATTYLPLYTYRTAFGFFRFGYASAMTVTMVLVTAAMVGVMALVVRRRRAWFAR